METKAAGYVLAVREVRAITVWRLVLQGFAGARAVVIAYQFLSCNALPTLRDKLERTKSESTD